MILSHDRRFLFGKPGEHVLHLVPVLDALLIRPRHLSVLQGRRTDRDVSQRFREPPPSHLAHDHASGDDGQVRGERRFTTKLTQNGVVVGEEREKNFGAQVVNVIGRDGDASRMSRVLNDVHKETEKPVDEILPCTGFFGQAALQKVAINLGQSHGKSVPEQSFDRRRRPQMEQFYSGLRI